MVNQHSSELSTVIITQLSEMARLIKDDEIIKNYAKQIINSYIFGKNYNYLSICKI